MMRFHLFGFSSQHNCLQCMQKQHQYFHFIVNGRTVVTESNSTVNVKLTT